MTGDSITGLRQSQKSRLTLKRCFPRDESCILDSLRWSIAILLLRSSMRSMWFSLRPRRMGGSYRHWSNVVLIDRTVAGRGISRCVLTSGGLCPLTWNRRCFLEYFLASKVVLTNMNSINQHHTIVRALSSSEALIQPELLPAFSP